jgi:hypothetical protein
MSLRNKRFPENGETPHEPWVDFFAGRAYMEKVLSNFRIIGNMEDRKKGAAR